MTDDESRKAFIDAIDGLFSVDTSQNSIDGSFLHPKAHLHFMLWQASAEYHTKRERERCANAFCEQVNRVAGLGDGWERLSAFTDRMMEP